MATNEKFRDATKLSCIVPNSTPSGAPVRIGAAATGRNGVTQTKTGAAGEAEGGNLTGRATVWFQGAHTFTVSFAIAAEFDPVYITSANALTATASGNQFYGWALNTKGATAGPLTVAIAN